MLNFLFSSYLGYLEHFLQYWYQCNRSSVDRAMDSLSGGSGFKSHTWQYFSTYLNEELNQIENNKNNKNASNSLVFGRWPQTKIESNIIKLGPAPPSFPRGLYYKTLVTVVITTIASHVRCWNCMVMYDKR